VTSEQGLMQPWAELPAGARAALEQQWAGVAAGALPCGSSVVDVHGTVIAAGRNHAYDAPGGIETRLRYPLQGSRLAHAEFNALALVPTAIDHATLTLWATQHPCSMCAAAARFVGIGRVRFIADDPSDDSPPEAIAASRGTVPYERLPSPLWAAISNLLFLYTSAVQRGEEARNLKMNRSRSPELVRLTLDLAQGDSLGNSARSGATLPAALAPHEAALAAIAELNFR